ncbi:MAG TPA: RHS repeat-associated core domain-containing protein [Bryobacteraceae bacterium]|nr:RHS repeat-associated core domain-containing protein [Bryobacteraceae bacterium]
MKRLSAFLFAPALFGSYVYYYSDVFSGVDATKWTQNGTVTASAAGLTGGSTNGGSLISSVPVPTGAYYEVKSTLTLAASGGTYVQYFHASADALSGPAASGTFYATEIQNPTFANNTCSATLALYQRLSGAVTLIASTTVPCRSGMVVRTVYTTSGQIAIYIDDQFFYWGTNTAIASGQPGVGVRGAPAGNSIARADLGPQDTIAPNPVNSQSVKTTVFPNYVDMQWQGVTDDVNGTGVALYQILRNGAFRQNLRGTSTFTDTTVAPGTTYTYTLYAFDFHFNAAPAATFTVTTPPAGALDARQIGVRNTGAYWGGAGEQIDMRSGNLNYMMPLLKPSRRASAPIPFSLSYNSQLWRQDPAGTWKLGADVGFGFGWRLQAGSLTPEYADYWNIDHYTYTDSTGAEYRLDVNTSGVWTSRQGIYLSFDTATNRLYSNDGSFWEFGATSAGTEEDAGTMYPTRLQDDKGNYITVSYNNGSGAIWPNSSARMSSITDVRATGGTPNYTFSYNTDPIPHLTGITGPTGSSEQYTFSYLGNQPLSAPFSPYPSYGTTTLLQTVTNNIPLSNTFQYNTSGELTRATLPYGGYLRWDYTTWTYPNSRSFREVLNRYVAYSAGAAEKSFYMERDAGDPSREIHWKARWHDQSKSPNPLKAWLFVYDTTQFNVGLPYSYVEKTDTVSWHHRWSATTWAQDANGNPYISAVDSSLHVSPAGAATKRSEQTLDIYGNVIQSKIFDYGNLTTPARTYTHTYLSDPQYLALYMRNRLLTTDVTNASQQTTRLVTNTWGDALGARPCPAYEAWTPGTVCPGMTSWDSTIFSAARPVHRAMLFTSATPGSTSYTQYDVAGNLTTGTGDGLTVSVTASAANAYAAPSAITNGGFTSSATWDALLNLTSQTGANGEVASIVYDSASRPTSTQSPYGATTNYTYTTSPPTVKASINGVVLGDIWDPLYQTWNGIPVVRWTKTTMDGLGHTIRVEKGHDSVTDSIVDTEYDACACSPNGRVKRTSLPYAPGGAILWTTYTYDDAGRTISVALPNQAGTTSYVYEGNTVTTTDPAGKWKKFTMDAMGNLTQVNEPNPAGGADYITTYSYDIVNHLVGVNMPRPSGTQTRTWVYDANQRLQSVTNPESGTVTFTYNANGDVATKTDAKGQRAEYSYDGNRRVISVRHFATFYPPPPLQSYTVEQTCEQVTYAYDSSPYTSFGYGRLASRTTGCDGGSPGQFTEYFSYNAPGGLTNKILSVRRNGVNNLLSASIGYDNEGRVTSESYPLGATSQYRIDLQGRPKRMTQGSFDVVRNAVYGAAGELRQLEYGVNQVDPQYGPTAYTTETRQYNSLYQLTRVTAGSGQDIEYRYSATQNNGKITQMKNWISGEEVSYQYDELQRLASATTTGPEWGLSFAYDGFGNRTAQSVTKGSAPTANFSYDTNNRITTAGYSYDANGNLTAMPGQTGLTYDTENRLLTATGETYGYTPDNKRVYKQLANGTEYFYFYLGNRQLGTYALGTNGFALVKQNVFFMGRRIYSYYAGGPSITPITDRLGSDIAGTKYFPFGEEATTSSQDREKFATYKRDATGLDYADQRYYSPGIGRFMSSDPAIGSGTTAGWNRYTYVEGDPVNYYDPSGEMAQAADGGGGGFGLLSFLTFGIFGGGVSPDYFVALSEREIWRRNPEKKVQEWDIRIAAAAADAARQQDDDGSALRYVDHLQVVNDCYTFYIGSIKRVRSYEVQDQMGKAWAGSVVVQEYNHIAYGNLDPEASNRSWKSVKFEDLLARGYGEDILQYQQFTVTYTLGGVPTVAAVPVRERNGQLYGTQGIKMMQDKVMINRDNGTGIPRCN